MILVLCVVGLGTRARDDRGDPSPTSAQDILSGAWSAGRSGIGNEGDDAHVRTAISAKQRERLESVLKPNRAWTYWEATNTRPSAAGRRLTACGQERVLAAGASRARTGRKQTLAMGALERGESEHKAVVALRES